MRAWAAVGVVLLAGCRLASVEKPAGASSFAVTVKGVFQGSGSGRTPLPVVTACVKRYGGQQTAVPAEERGTPDCPYGIARGTIEYDVEVQALDVDGKPVAFGGSVSMRVIPGDLVGGYAKRVMTVADGKGTGTVAATHQYGGARIWVEDAPPRPIYDAGSLVTEGLPEEPAKRSYATGTSRVITFEDHTLQSLQIPDGFDNRSSQFGGEFVVVGKNPGESGREQLQSCVNDPDRDGKPLNMVVTGIEPTGFYVTDLTGCRLVEQTRDSSGSTQVRTPEDPEPCVVQVNGVTTPIERTDAGMGTCLVAKTACRTRTNCTPYLPGTFGSIFIFNFSYPEGLNVGDRLYTLGGSVQEFTSTTQLTFPSWTVAEHVRLLPPEQWTKWLSQVPVPVVGGRMCGQDNVLAPFLTDSLCGHNRRNLKMESLESALVRLPRVRFPTVFKNCDFNADGQVPFFCENPEGEWHWDSCGGIEPDVEKRERECVQDCTIGRAEHAGKICSEEANFLGFGQYVVELSPPGPAWAGLDESNPARTQKLPLLFAPPPTDGGQDGGQDAGPRDAGPTDAGVSADAGQDAGQLDASVPLDGGADAGGPIDAGPADAGSTDAGGTDAGVTMDAGADDAGTATDGGTGDGGMVIAGDAGLVPMVTVSAGFGPASTLVIVCDTPAYVRSGRTASATDRLLPAREVLELTLGATDTTAAFLAQADPGTCYVSQHPKTRLNLITKDAVPELNPDCRPDDADADKAQQCRFLRGAQFDVVGHLRHIQPARPRWGLLPRDPDDLCCYPGPGLECPRPIRRCAP